MTWPSLFNDASRPSTPPSHPLTTAACNVQAFGPSAFTNGNLQATSYSYSAPSSAYSTPTVASAHNITSWPCSSLSVEYTHFTDRGESDPASFLANSLHSTELMTPPNQHLQETALQWQGLRSGQSSLSQLLAPHSAQHAHDTKEAGFPTIQASSTNMITPQNLDTQQYLTLMSETANSVQALAEPQHHYATLPLSFSTLSTSTSTSESEFDACASTEPIDIPSHHRYQQHAVGGAHYATYNPHHRHLHLASLRRTQSMDAFSSLSSTASSPLLSTATSVTDSPAGTPLHHPGHGNSYFIPAGPLASVDSGVHLGMLATLDPAAMMMNEQVYTPMSLGADDGSHMQPCTQPPSSFIPSSYSACSSFPSASSSPSLSHLSAFSSLSLTSGLYRRRLDNMSVPSYALTSSACGPSTVTDATVPCIKHDIKAEDSGNDSPRLSSKGSRARYVCHVPNCHRTFSRPFNLKSHGLTHETHRPHGCPQCPKTFARVHDRDRHMKGHLQEKAHACVVCLGRFARQDAVTRHLKIANGQNPCAIILRTRGVGIKEVAAGRVQRSDLGDEAAIRSTLESLEEQVRKQKAGKVVLQ
ncbi:hypothetical protein BGZ72_004511 [Mortierella alpina]|nr:hypothetical protein BGZ72_004511 [Mortierella alpina]